MKHAARRILLAHDATRAWLDRADRSGVARPLLSPQALSVVLGR